MWKLIIEAATITNAITTWYHILYYFADCLTKMLLGN